MRELLFGSHGKRAPLYCECIAGIDLQMAAKRQALT